MSLPAPRRTSITSAGRCSFPCIRTPTPRTAIANGNGYTTGGATLAGKTITYDSASDQVRWDANDVSWTFTASKTWRNGVIWINTAGASTTDPLYAVLVWDSDQTVSTSYTLQWDSAGILFIDVT